MCTRKEVWPFRLDYHEMAFYAYTFFLAQQPPLGQDLLIHEVSRWHTTMHHSLQDFYGPVIISLQRLLLDITQHSQQTNIHATGGIRTHNLSRRAAVDCAATGTGYMHIYCNELHLSGIVGLCVENIGKTSFTPVLKTAFTVPILRYWQ